MTNFKWLGRKVLVTGAAGFIGSHLAERLVELGANVRAFVRYNSGGNCGWLESSSIKREIEIIAGDVCDFLTVREAMRDRDVVFHLAALIGIPYSYRAPQAYVRTNIEGTFNILEAARIIGATRVLCTSTSEVYGSAKTVPMNETHTLQAQSPYSASKIAADKLAESYFRSFGLPVSIVRPFNTYGPRQSERAVIPTIITQALAGSEVRVGALEPTRDFNFVADTVEAFVRTAECDRALGQVLNFGSGLEISIRDLTHRIGSLLGKELVAVSEEIRLRPENSEVTRLVADSTKARDMVGWTPRFTLEQGLSKTIAWLRGQQGATSRISEYAV